MNNLGAGIVCQQMGVEGAENREGKTGKEFAWGALFLCITTMFPIVGCDNSDSGTGPTGGGQDSTKLLKSSIVYSYEALDTVPSAFLQISPKLKGFSEDSDGYVTFKVENKNKFEVSIKAQASITNETVISKKTVVLKAGEKREIRLFPILSPNAFDKLTELSLVSYALNLDASYNDQTISLVDETPKGILTAKDVVFWDVPDDQTGGTIDLSSFIVGWVTPHASAIDTLIRLAAEYHPEHALSGYQGTPDPETGAIAAAQAKAIFDALKNDYQITYINSPIAFPGGTQRVKYPSDALHLASANCIDGTVLFASALENIGLNPYIVLIPGHAFVAWETWDNSGVVASLETTMIGDSDFETAYARGNEEYNRELTNKNFEKGLLQGGSKLIGVKEMRGLGVTPLFKKAQ